MNSTRVVSPSESFDRRATTTTMAALFIMAQMTVPAASEELGLVNMALRLGRLLRFALPLIVRLQTQMF